MPSSTVRVKESTGAVLRKLSKESGEPMSLLVEKAVECYRRQRLLEEANAAWADLRADPEAWAEELAERRGLEATLMDDLEDEEPWAE